MRKIMPQNTGLAGLGMETPVQAIMPQSGKKPRDDEESNRYKAMFNSMYRIFYPSKSSEIDQQTDLQWINIEGEVMMEILKLDIISGVPYTHIEGDPYFSFASPHDCMTKLLADIFVEKISERYLLPSLTSLKKNLNTLLVSESRKGRTELVQAFTALNLSMQEHEHTDALNSRGFRVS
jgi:hypothetical protein